MYTNLPPSIFLSLKIPAITYLCFLKAVRRGLLLLIYRFWTGCLIHGFFNHVVGQILHPHCQWFFYPWANGTFLKISCNVK